MTKSSLKHKLMLFFILTITIPALVTLFFMYQQSLAKMNDLVDTTLNNSVATVDYFLKQRAGSALVLAQKYGQNAELKQAFINKDRVKLNNLLEPIYSDLKEDNHLTVFEFGDNNGIVFARGHNPGKFGDSKAGNASIEAALNGSEVKGLEIGQSGLAVRAFVPIKDNNTIIGTFQVGFDDSVLIDIQNSIHGNIALFNKDIMFKTTNDNEKNNIGKPLEDTSIFKRVSKGESVKILDRDKNIRLYYPLYDTLGKSVLGMISITQDMSFVNDFKQMALIRSVILIAVILLLALVIGYWLSKSFTGPIARISTLIKRTSDLNLVHDASLDSLTRHKDEIGTMAQSVAQMNESLRNMASKVIDISTELAANSQEMAAAAEQSSKANNQVALTIGQISEGNVSLANTISNVNETISDMVKDIGDANLITLQSADYATKSLELVSEGQNAVGMTTDSLRQNIIVIDEVSDSINDLNELIKKVDQITEVINSIAEQTNLLALNAAIEAARAGDAGRGFAVVAEEVRKLAEGSSSAANEIAEIIKETGSKSMITVEIIEKTKEAVSVQEKAVYTTNEAFNNIKYAVEDIVDRTKKASNMLKNVDIASKQINDRTQDMAAIAEQSAASSEEISASSEEQLASVEMLAQAAADLSSMATKLSNEANKFKI